MSDLSAVEQQIFDQLVHTIYENGSEGKKLRQTVRNRTNFVGSSIQWRKVDSVQMTESAFQTTVPLTSAVFTPVISNLVKYILAIPVDDIERFVVNFDERQESAMLCASALARREDQLVINSMINSGTGNTIAEGGANLTFAKMREINSFFSRKGVPSAMRHLIISAAGEDSLIAQSQLTSSDYINVKPITSGTVDGSNVMGMTVHVIPDMIEGGLPLAGDIRSCFAYHGMSTGYGARDFGTRVDEIPREDIWQVKIKTFADCKTIDATGIIKIDIDETK